MSAAAPGRPVVLVPGAWTTAMGFADVRDALVAAGHPTEVVELPARASRVPQLDRGGLGAIDRAVDAAIARADGPPVLAGHSLGGLAALRASRRNDLAALVLLMPAPPTGLWRTVAAGALREPLNAVGLLGTALSVTAVSRLTSVTPKGLYSADVSDETRRRARTFRADESWAVLAGLLLGSGDDVLPTDVPTLVVGGAQDGITPPAVVRELAERLAATYEEVDVAHAFNEEPTFGDVVDVVLGFLDGRGRERRDSNPRPPA